MYAYFNVNLICGSRVKELPFKERVNLMHQPRYLAYRSERVLKIAVTSMILRELHYLKDFRYQFDGSVLPL